MACTSTPTISDNCLIHRIWNISAAVPDSASNRAGAHSPASGRASARGGAAARPARKGVLLMSSDP